MELWPLLKGVKVDRQIKKRTPREEASLSNMLRERFTGVLTAGRIGVPSTRTANSWFGSRSRALRMVGATWAVPTTVFTVLG
jgi:hypothetical protein